VNNNGKKTGLSAALRTTKPRTQKHNIQTSRANESKVVSFFSLNLLKHVYFKWILMIINKDLDLARFQPIIFVYTNV